MFLHSTTPSSPSRLRSAAGRSGSSGCPVRVRLPSAELTDVRAADLDTRRSPLRAFDLRQAQGRPERRRGTTRLRAAPSAVEWRPLALARRLDRRRDGRTRPRSGGRDVLSGASFRTPATMSSRSARMAARSCCRASLRAAIALGARLAEPGEFTLRAFLNGKLDLVQAEAVGGSHRGGDAAAGACRVRSARGHADDAR